MTVGPAARWIAPSTPPPPARALLAALTTASTLTCVISPASSLTFVCARIARVWGDDRAREQTVTISADATGDTERHRHRGDYRTDLAARARRLDRLPLRPGLHRLLRRQLRRHRSAHPACAQPRDHGPGLCAVGLPRLAQAGVAAANSDLAGAAAAAGGADADHAHERLPSAGPRLSPVVVLLITAICCWLASCRHRSLVFASAA